MLKPSNVLSTSIIVQVLLQPDEHLLTMHYKRPVVVCLFVFAFFPLLFSDSSYSYVNKFFSYCQRLLHWQQKMDFFSFVIVGLCVTLAFILGYAFSERFRQTSPVLQTLSAADSPFTHPI